MTETTRECSELELEAARNHYIAVGMVAGTWASFERRIDNHALELANIPSDRGCCFTAQIMGSANKLNAYMAIAHLCGAKKTIESLELFAKDTVKLSERRNRTVHDPWILGANESPHRSEITAKRKLRKLLVPTPTPKIVKLSTEIVAHIERFLAIDSQVKAEVAA